MTDAATPVDAFYTQYAALYDRIASDAPFATGLRKSLVTTVGLDRGDVVVEMGCGTGANFPVFRERVGPEGAVVGVDVSTGVLQRAQERIEKAGWDNVYVVRADANCPPLAPGTLPRSAGPVGEVDVVVGSFVTGMFDDPTTAIEEWCRIVGAGGDGESDDGSVERDDGSVESEGVGVERDDGSVERDDGRIGLLDLARSTHPIGRSLNPLFALFVWAGTPPGTSKRQGSSVRVLDERVRDAHAWIHEHCAEATTTRQLAGFARITAARVDGSVTDDHSE